jgi:hypothetical protein
MCVPFFALFSPKVGAEEGGSACEQTKKNGLNESVAMWRTFSRHELSGHTIFSSSSNTLQILHNLHGGRQMFIK